jgi:hypothetical protein
VAGGTWLGRDVSPGDAIVVDEENGRAMIHRRLRALGVTSDTAKRLDYFAGNAAQLGDDGRHDEWLHRLMAAATDPRLLVIDTAMSATALNDVNDNTDVGKLLARLGRIVKAYDCAAVLLHHERKAQQGSGGNGRSARVMGANQFRAQVEAHIGVASVGEKEHTRDPDGTERAAFELDVSVEKLRDGVEPPVQRARIETVSHEDRLQTVQITAADAPPPSEDPARMTKTQLMTAAITVALKAAPLSSADLASAVGCKLDDSTFKRVRRAMDKANVIEKNEADVWTLAIDPEPAI